MANALTPFLHPTGGFGKAAYDRAIAGGLTPSQIKALLPGSGATVVGPQVQALLDQISVEPSSSSSYQQQITDLAKSYEDRFSTASKNYEAQLASMRSSNAALEGKLGSLQTELGQATAARDAASKQVATLQDQYNAEREIAINSQLSAVRSGSTVGGTGGFGSGNVNAGRPAYQGSGDADNLLSDYKKKIISSGANSNGQTSVVPMIQWGGGSGNSGSSSGGNGRPAVTRAALDSYYARRFG